MPRDRAGAWIGAVSLVAAPLVLASLGFWMQAPGGASGVYAEVESHGQTAIYSVPGRAVGAVPTMESVTPNAPAIVDGVLLSFCIVAPSASAADAIAASVKSYFLVVNGANAFQAEPLAAPVTIRRINPRVLRLTSPEFEREGLAFQYYRQVLVHAAGSKATLDVVAAFVVEDSAGRRQMYSVRLGAGT